MLDYGVIIAFDSLIFYESGLKSFQVMKVINVLSFLLPSFILLFASSFNRKPLNLTSRVIVLLSALVALTILFVSSLQIYFIVLDAYMLFGVLTVGVALFHTSGAFRKGYHESG